jgi:hypothetical protein
MEHRPVHAESALGRPPRWSVALPALVIGCGACLLVAYGRWALPARLPSVYARHLEQATAQYASLLDQPGFVDDARWIQLADERDIIFSRLVVLERRAPARYWEWVEFLSEHATATDRRLHDPVASIPEALRTALRTQAGRFELKAQELCEQLAANASPYRGQAVLRLTLRDFQAGLGPSGVSRAAELAERLRGVLEPTDGPAETSFSPHERDRAQWLLAALLVEAAWRRDDGSGLVCDQHKLAAAQRCLPAESPPQHAAEEPFDKLSEKTTESSAKLPVEADRDAGATGYSGPLALEWTALARLLEAYQGQSGVAPAANSPSTAAAPAAASRAHESSRGSWHHLWAQLQLACLDGEWVELEFQLPSEWFPGRSEADDRALLHGTARTICRLVATGQARSAEDGVLLVAKRLPHLAEFSELIWRSAAQRASVGSEAGSAATAGSEPTPTGATETAGAAKTAVPTHWQAPALELPVQALGLALRDESDAAREVLEQITRDRGQLFLLSRVVLWRSQRLPHESEERERLLRLQRQVVQAEPGGGFNWFVLGALQLTAGQLSEAIASAEKAEQLLGQVAAITDLLQAARAAQERVPR